MLKTNGSAAGRQLYSDDFLSTITCVPYVERTNTSGNLPFGIGYVTMRIRFAGLIRPETSGPK